MAFLSFIPGSEYLTPEEQSGATAMSLMGLGAGLLSGAPKGFAPALGEGVQNLMGAWQQAGAQGMGRVKAQQEQLKAEGAYASGMGPMYKLQAQMQALRTMNDPNASEGDKAAAMAFVEPGVLKTYAEKNLQMTPQGIVPNQLLQSNEAIQKGRIAATEQMAKGFQMGQYGGMMPNFDLLKGTGLPYPGAQQQAPQITPQQFSAQLPPPQNLSPEQAQWRNRAYQLALQEGLDPSAARVYSDGIVHQESGYNPSPPDAGAGAVGLAQIHPSNFADAQKQGLDVANNSDHNLTYGARLFKDAIQKSGGDIVNALKTYFAGPNTSKWGPKTEAYPQQVLSHLSPTAANATPMPGMTVGQNGTYFPTSMPVQSEMVGKQNTERLKDLQDLFDATANDRNVYSRMSSIVQDLQNRGIDTSPNLPLAKGLSYGLSALGMGSALPTSMQQSLRGAQALEQLEGQLALSKSKSLGRMNAGVLGVLQGAAGFSNRDPALLNLQATAAQIMQERLQSVMPAIRAGNMTPEQQAQAISQAEQLVSQDVTGDPRYKAALAEYQKKLDNLGAARKAIAGVPKGFRPMKRQ